MNDSTTNPKKSQSLLVLIFVIAAVATGYYIFQKGLFGQTKTNEYDIVNKENNKIALLFNNQLNSHIGSVSGGMYSGYTKMATQSIVQFFGSIKTIETYARYGSASNDKFNKVELKLTFYNGRVLDKVYTGMPVIRAYGATLLLKLDMQNGKAKTAYTNGVEFTSSPSNFENYMQDVIDNCISVDSRANPNKYYPAQKTQEDIKNDWDSVK